MTADAQQTNGGRETRNMEVDVLIVACVIAQNFLLAAAKPNVKYHAEQSLVEEAKKIAAATKLPLPDDEDLAEDQSERSRSTIN